MKRILLIGICLFTVNSLFAQKTVKDSTTLTLNYGSKASEVMEFFRLQDIDFFKITSNDKQLQDYYFLFTTKTYEGDKLAKADTLLESSLRKHLSYGKTDTSMVFSVITQPLGRDSIKFSYNLSRFGTKKTYMKMPVNTYSLRDAINSHDSPVKVPIGKSFPLLVYSLPYEDPKQPGYLFYCALTADGTPPEKWGSKFGVKHLMIIELSILPK